MTYDDTDNDDMHLLPPCLGLVTPPAGRSADALWLQVLSASLFWKPLSMGKEFKGWYVWSIF